MKFWEGKRNLGVESSHKFNVEGFKRVSGRLNEVDTCMDTIIDDVCPVWFILSFQIRIESRLDTFQNRFPTTTSKVISLYNKTKEFGGQESSIPIFVVNKVTESR